jgi:hypothetical protein
MRRAIWSRRCACGSATRGGMDLSHRSLPARTRGCGLGLAEPHGLPARALFLYGYVALRAQRAESGACGVPRRSWGGGVARPYVRTYAEQLAAATLPHRYCLMLARLASLLAPINGRIA